MTTKTAAEAHADLLRAQAAGFDTSGWPCPYTGRSASACDTPDHRNCGEAK